MNRVAIYLLALLCIGGVFAVSGQEEQHRPHALHVLLGHTCPEEAESSRLLAVRYLPNGRYYLNDESANELDLRRLVAHATEHRIEKLVWLAADRRVEYGGLATLISNLQADTPDLHIALATETEVGPVDPVQIQQMAGMRADGTPIGVMPCISPDAF